MSPSREKFICLRTVSGSQHIAKINICSFVFIYWFNFVSCFLIWILIGRSGYYMNWFFVTYFFEYFENVISFTNVPWSNNNAGMILVVWNIIFIANVIDFWFFYFIHGVFIFHIFHFFSFFSYFFSIIIIYLYVTNSTFFNILLTYRM